jgi:hypothetical protein
MQQKYVDGSQGTLQVQNKQSCAAACTSSINHMLHKPNTPINPGCCCKSNRNMVYGSQKLQRNAAHLVLLVLPKRKRLALLVCQPSQLRKKPT